MPVSMSRLKECGITTAKLKPLFTADVKLPEITRLLNLIRDRIQDGYNQNFRDFKIWSAIDYAFDSSFYQTTPTLVRHILDSTPDNQDPALYLQAIRKSVGAWGLKESDLFITEGTGPNTIYHLNVPTFFNVLLPIVKPLITIRWAKLYNDRRQNPLLKYEPREYTEINKLKCEAVTDIVGKISDDLGYSAILRQAIFQQLMYGVSIAFPKETWFVEEQEDDDGKVQVSREGIRYEQPHPTRMFYDLSAPLSTINSDSGVMYGAFWRVVRYGDIKANPLYWNKGSIPLGTNWWDPQISSNFFQEVYPCKMEFPVLTANATASTDRQDRAAFYATNMLDKAVFVTNIFMKLVPKRWKLGDYKYPVWFRFEVASDNTVLWCEPVPYCPMWYVGCDADNQRSRNGSLALEIVPWQDILGNQLSQILLTCKQNLANLVLWDKDQLKEPDIKNLRNNGEAKFRAMQFLGFSAQEDRRKQSDPTKALHAFNFPKQNTAELVNIIGTILNLMDRLLVMSPQEIGQSATHEQSATELRTVTESTSTRTDFTGSFIDDGVFAWKRQLLEASTQFLDENFEAQVSESAVQNPAVLKQLGFELLHEPETPDAKYQISGKTKMLALTSFSSPLDGPSRISDSKIGQIVFQAVQSVANNPMLGQAVGAKPLLKLMTEAAKMLGAPKDFKLSPDPQGQAAQSPQDILKETQKVVNDAINAAAPHLEQAILQQVQQGVTQPVSQQLQKQQAELQQLMQALQGEKQKLDATTQLVLKLVHAEQVKHTAAQPQPNVTVMHASPGVTVGPPTMAVQPPMPPQIPPQ